VTLKRSSFTLLALGLFVAVYLASQFGTGLVETATVAEDKIEWMDSDAALVKYYSPQPATSTASFYIRDAALQTIKTATSTWTITTTVEAGSTFNVYTGALSAGVGGFALGAGGADADAVTPANTPMSERPTATIGGTDNFVNSYTAATGLIALNGAATAPVTVVVTWKYHVTDTYSSTVDTVSALLAKGKRAKVTSGSDAGGEWVVISEVAAEGSSTPNPTSQIFQGSIIISDSAGATAANDGHLWVQDGDSIDVTYYAADGTTAIDSTSATIDDAVPTVSGQIPADGSITSGTAPQITFVIEDDGSGLSTTLPGDNITLAINGCPVADTELFFNSLSSSRFDIRFSSGVGVKWSDAATGGCDARSGGGFAVDSTTLTPLTAGTVHGGKFSWTITATDAAGNSKTVTGTDQELTIDSVNPDMLTGEAGKGWDTVGKKDKSQSDSIKLTFSESLDETTVAVGDFSLDTGSIISVLVAGDGAADGTLVYLTTAADLSPSAKPKVEIIGSVSDRAGNTLKPATGKTVADTVTATDGVKPTLSGVAFAASLLAKAGTAGITFSADENLTGNDKSLALGCSCGIVTGDGDLIGDKLSVTLSTPTTGSATFKQTAYKTSGAYGVMLQGKDANGNLGWVGAVTKTSENVSSQITADIAGGATFAVKLVNWPIADSDGDGTLADEFSVELNGSSTVAVASAIDWSENETVTLAIAPAIPGSTLGTTVKVTYKYVDAAQVVQVDTLAPTIAAFSPADGATTENSSPFISVKWDEDEYAGDTYKTVTLTKATLTQPDATVVDILASMNSTDQKTFFYRPATALALGEYKLTVSAVDAAGNTATDKSSKFEVKERAKKKIALLPGWNLVSVPGTPSNTDINAVITVPEIDTVLTYDATTAGGWLTAIRDTESGTLVGTLTDITATRAYWVHTTNDSPIEVDITGVGAGTAQLPPALSLAKGWNLIPAVSLDPDFTSVDKDTYLSGLKWSKGYSYDRKLSRFVSFVPVTTPVADSCKVEGSTTAHTATDADPGNCINSGYGYWVYLTESGVLIP